MKNISKSLTKISLSFLVFCLTIYVIFYLCYFLGHRVLEGGMLGGDTPYHLALMHALNRFYPKIPIWFPFAGSGNSLVLGYWSFSYYLAIFASHLGNLTMEQWVRLLEFLTVPIVCIEIYIYLWVRFKNQAMATVGTLMYPLSSMAWGWVALSGFYAMQMSTMFYVPAFMFFDLYLESILTNSPKVTKRRVCLLGFFISIGLGTLVHGSFIPVLYLGLPLYALARSQMNPRLDEKRTLSLFKSLKVLLILLPLGLLGGAFILIPQYKYFSLQPFTPTYGPADTPYLPWRQFLGFERTSPFVASFYASLFMSLLVSTFATVGGILALLKRKFILALAVVAVFYIFVLSEARFLAMNFSFLRFLIMPVCDRLSSITAVYLTILAAYGLWNLADLPSSFLRKLAAKTDTLPKSPLLKNWAIKLTYLISLILTIVISVKSFYFFRQKQIYKKSVVKENILRPYQGYGSLGFIIPFCMVPGWENEVEKGTSCDSYKPKGVLNNAETDFWDKELITKMSGLSTDRLTRVSISPYLGSFMYSFPMHSEASMVSAPAGPSVINLDWLGIHDDILFLQGKHPSSEVDEIAKWFGTKYSFIHVLADKDAIPRYNPENWKDIFAVSDVMLAKEFVNTPGVVNVSNKPAVLVIGSKKNQSYSTFFQVLMKGVLGYDKALVIEGKENIDDYDLSELKSFSAIVLTGYTYKNRDKTFANLSNYVTEGGSLFIDSGWQYISKDWGASSGKVGEYLPIKLPEPFPVSSTLWGNESSWVNARPVSLPGEGIDVSKFGALSWQGNPWGLAKAEISNLRSWAKPVLAVGDKVVIAEGELGKGKVVWSGMNIFSHAYDKENPEEYKLLKNIFDFLLPVKIQQKNDILTSWNYPDEVDFSVQKPTSGESFLYFAETYTPYWKAEVVSAGLKRNLQVYRAGPGFMAVRVSNLSSGSKIILKFDMNAILIFSFGMTLAGFVLIFAGIFDSLFFASRMESALKKTLVPKLSRNIQKTKKGFDEEEEY